MININLTTALSFYMGRMENTYRKIPKISPGAYIFSTALFEGLICFLFFALPVSGGLYLEGLIHEGAYFRNFTV